MDLKSWMNANSPGIMVHWATVRGPSGDGTVDLERWEHKPSRRRLRLLLTSLCRELWGDVPTAGRAAIVVTEAYVDGLIDSRRLQSGLEGLARDYDINLASGSPLAPRPGAQGRQLAERACLGIGRMDDTLVNSAHASFARVAVGHLDNDVQSDVIRDALGVPMHKLAITGGTLTYTYDHEERSGPFVVTAEAASIARAAYDRAGGTCDWCGGTGWDRIPDVSGGWPNCAECGGSGRGGAGTIDPASLAVLSDALEEAGCTSEPLLMHLRGFEPCPVDGHESHFTGRYNYCDRCRGHGHLGWRRSRGVHRRGCWALDAVLGRSLGAEK